MKKIIILTATIFITITLFPLHKNYNLYNKKLTHSKAENVQQIIKHQHETISKLQQKINELNQLVESNKTPFWHNLTNEEIKDNFLKSEIPKKIASILGFSLMHFQKTDITVLPNHIIIYQDTADFSIILLSYSINKPTNEITWAIEAYRLLGNPWRTTRKKPTSQPIINTETISIKFYYVDWNCHNWDSAFPYHEKKILKENSWYKTINYISLYNNIHIRDLWHENNTLYVELKPSTQWRLSAGLGNIINAQAMIKTLSNFPNTKNVIFLKYNEPMGPIYNDFCLNKGTFLWINN